MSRRSSRTSALSGGRSRRRSCPTVLLVTDCRRIFPPRRSQRSRPNFLLGQRIMRGFVTECVRGRRRPSFGNRCVCKIDHGDPKFWKVEDRTFWNCPQEGDPDEILRVIACKTRDCTLVVGTTNIMQASSSGARSVPHGHELVAPRTWSGPHDVARRRRLAPAGGARGAGRTGRAHALPASSPGACARGAERGRHGPLAREAERGAARAREARAGAASGGAAVASVERVPRRPVDAPRYWVR
jgi:hypothetical protein